jgi:hypothetical protein
MEAIRTGTISPSIERHRAAEVQLPLIDPSASVRRKAVPNTLDLRTVCPRRPASTKPARRSEDNDLPRDDAFHMELACRSQPSLDGCLLGRS